MSFDEGVMNKLAQFAILGLLGWQVVQTQQLSVDTAVISARVELLSITIKEASIDRYTKAEAKSDLALLSQRILRLEEWNGNLSSRLATLEQEARAK